MTVTLEREEWDRVLAILSQAPWNVVNPLIMKIGEQCRLQVPRPNGVDPDMVAQQEPTKQ